MSPPTMPETAAMTAAETMTETAATTVALTEKQEYHSLMVHIFNHNLDAVRNYISAGKNINFYTADQSGGYHYYEENHPLLVLYDPWINVHDVPIVTSFLDTLDEVDHNNMRPRMTEFTPLSYACFLGLEDIARALVEGGADVNPDAAARIPRDGDCGIYHIGRRTYTWTEIPAPFEVTSTFPPLWWACVRRQNDLVRFLLRSGANVHQMYELDRIDGFLQFACECGNVEVVEYLLQHGETVADYPDLLLGACHAYDLGMIRLLLPHGANPLGEPYVDRLDREHACLPLLERRYVERNMRNGAFVTPLDLTAVYCHDERTVLENYEMETSLGYHEAGLRALAALILAGENVDNLRCPVIRRWVEPLLLRMEYENINWHIAVLEAKRKELVKAMAGPPLARQYAEYTM